MRSSEEEKIGVFRKRFAGRGDVWARRFVGGRSGRVGYAPVCANEWVKGVCGKRCGRCGRRAFVPLGDGHVRMHLVGRDERGRDFAMGVYPLLEGDLCRFAAVDFGGAAWRRDAGAVRDAAARLGFPALVERSRSGEGAHLWWFFDGVVAARVARRLVFGILSEAFGRCPELGFGVYDRVFPDRDTLPRDGFGRAIALPLQGGARREGRSVFVDGDFEVVRDPWAALSAVRPLDGEWVAGWVAEAERTGRVFGVARAEEVMEGRKVAAPAGKVGVVR